MSRAAPHWIPTLAALVLLVAAPACEPAPCPSDPLAPLSEPAWVVRFNETPMVDPSTVIPGVDRFTDPPGVGTYAAFAIYDTTPSLLDERWVDSYAAYPRASAGVDAASALPSELSAGALTLLLASGPRPAVTFDLASGSAREAAPWANAPEAGGQLVDLAMLGDGTALAARRRGTGGVGGDLVLLDVADERGVIATYGLESLSTGLVEPIEIALLAGADGVASRAVVAIALADESDAGAVAVVDLASGALSRLDLPGASRWCLEVSSLAPDAAIPSRARVAVLCAGDRSLAVDERAGAGLILLEADASESVRIAGTVTAAALPARRPPEQSLRGLEGAWVAYVSLGDPGEPRPDALVVANLSSGAAEVLYEERWSDVHGPALGDGAFDGELLWPSVSGVMRWSLSDGVFTPLEPAPLPSCHTLPARVVRAIPR